MEFRWVALIALWTLLSGPIFHTNIGPRTPHSTTLVPLPSTPPSTKPSSIRIAKERKHEKVVFAFFRVFAIRIL